MTAVKPKKSHPWGWSKNKPKSSPVQSKSSPVQSKSNGGK